MKPRWGMTCAATLATLLMCGATTASAQDNGRDYNRDYNHMNQSPYDHSDQYGRQWDTGTVSPGEFVDQAARGGMAEVALGRLAMQRTRSREVRRFAQDMVNGHRMANHELMRLANQRGFSVPNRMDMAHTETLRWLSSLSGDRFDRAYMKEMVRDHDRTVAMFERYAQDGTDRELRAFAIRTLPTLRDHQQMAHSVADDVGARVAARQY